MTDTNTTTSKPKQYTFGVSETHKNEIGELRKDFTRPAAVKNASPVPMSEKEALEVLFKVATDRRFKTRPVMETVEIDGEEITVDALDSDGLPLFETIDLFEIEWEAIKTRDYTATSEAANPVDRIIAMMKKAWKGLGHSDAIIEEMVANTLATMTPPAPAE